MNTTIVLGNGFDVCLGLHTKYVDFYRGHYLLLNRDHLPDYLKTFRESIQNYVSNNGQKTDEAIDWSDLELALGKYSERLEDPQEYLNIVLDINKELKSYITTQDKVFKIGSDQANKIINDFSQPESTNYMSYQDNNNIRTFKKNMQSAEYINFMSFNYTSTLEEILALRDTKTILSNSANFSVVIKDVLHIHSSINQDPAILVGVNSSDQIANTAFRNNPDILDVIVKPLTNDMFGNGKNDTANNMLNNSQLIVLFGLSIGETDKKWWEVIGGQLSKASCRVIYFVYDNPGETNPLLLGSKRREYQNKLLKATGISEKGYDSLRNLITIAYNTNYLK